MLSPEEAFAKLAEEHPTKILYNPRLFWFRKCCGKRKLKLSFRYKTSGEKDSGWAAICVFCGGVSSSFDYHGGYSYYTDGWD